MGSCSAPTVAAACVIASTPSALTTLRCFTLPSTLTNLDEPSTFAAGFGEAFTAGEGAFSFSAMSTCVESAGFVIILVSPERSFPECARRGHHDSFLKRDEKCSAGRLSSCRVHAGEIGRNDSRPLIKTGRTSATETAQKGKGNARHLHSVS